MKYVGQSIQSYFISDVEELLPEWIQTSDSSWNLWSNQHSNVAHGKVSDHIKQSFKADFDNLTTAVWL